MNLNLYMSLHRVIENLLFGNILIKAGLLKFTFYRIFNIFNFNYNVKAPKKQELV